MTEKLRVKKYKLVGTKQGEVKNSTGCGEAKELTCMTRGHELREELLQGMDIWLEGAMRERLGQL